MSATKFQDQTTKAEQAIAAARAPGRFGSASPATSYGQHAIQLALIAVAEAVLAVADEIRQK